MKNNIKLYLQRERLICVRRYNISIPFIAYHGLVAFDKNGKGGEYHLVFYFTATGNSLYVAKQLEETPVSIAQAIHDDPMLYQAEKIGIVCPVFGHEVPALVREFLEKADFQTSYFYMILTYGNRHGGAAELAENMLEQLGIRPSYINVVWMVDNYLPAFDMEEQKKLDKQTDAQIRRIREDIEAGRKYRSPVTDKDRAAHREFLAYATGMPEDTMQKLYRITEDCIGCEICTRVCPKQCFTMDGHKSVWHYENCISCMACIHACPMMAIRLNIPEKNPKARYRNEHISICEIVDANDQLKNKKSI